jgi:hypothetical protein
MSVMDIPIGLSVVNPLYYTAKTTMNSRSECKKVRQLADISEEYIASIFKTTYAKKTATMLCLPADEARQALYCPLDAP